MCGPLLHGMLAGAAMVTGWYKLYYASKPALFLARPYESRDAFDPTS